MRRDPSLIRFAGGCIQAHDERRQGYDGVGMAELEARTGLNRSSLYNSFGDKNHLFASALGRYTETLGSPKPRR
jgi:AcrR family transcriptional regulator